MAATNDSQTTDGHFATQKYTPPALIPSLSGTDVSISAQTKATSKKTLPSQPAVDGTSTSPRIPLTSFIATSNNTGSTSSSTTIQVTRSLFSDVPPTLKSSVHANSFLASTGSTSATFTSVLVPPTNTLTTSASQSEYFHIASTPSQAFLQTSLPPSGKTNTSKNITAIQTNTGHISPFSVSSISNFGHSNTSVENPLHSSTTSAFTHSATILSPNSTSSRFPFRPHESHNLTSSASAKTKTASASHITSSRSSSVNRSHQFTSSKFVQSTAIPTAFSRPIRSLSSTKGSSTRSSVSSEATHPPVSSHTITSAPSGRTTHTHSDDPCNSTSLGLLGPGHVNLQLCRSSPTSQRGTSATESRKSSALSKTTLTHVVPSKSVSSSLLSHHTEKSSTSTQKHLTSSGKTHSTTSTHSTRSSHTQTSSSRKQTTTQSKKTSSTTHSHTTSLTTIHSVPNPKSSSINTTKKTSPTSTHKSANIHTTTTKFKETSTTTTSSRTRTGITPTLHTSLTPFILPSSKPSLSPTTISSTITPTLHTPFILPSSKPTLSPTAISSTISSSAIISFSSSSSFTTSSIAPTHTTFPIIHSPTHGSSYSTSRHTFSVTSFTTDLDTVPTPWPKIYTFDNQTVHPQSLAGLTIGLSVFLYLLITVGVIIVLHLRHRRAEARTFRYTNLRV